MFIIFYDIGITPRAMKSVTCNKFGRSLSGTINGSSWSISFESTENRLIFSPHKQWTKVRRKK
jgi:hypothetical protein